MNLDANQIESKRRVGSLDGQPVFGVTTKGGFSMVVALGKGDSVNTLGVGSHPALARYGALKREPRLKWEELSKSDSIPEDILELLSPRWEALCDRIREREGR